MGKDRRVHDIALASIETIPPEFIIRSSENDQPSDNITAVPRGGVLEIPTVGFGDPDVEKVLVGVAEASRKWGMFQVVNHGIPDEVIRKLQEVGKEFFELPREEKELYAKAPDSKSLEGYGTKLQKEVNGKKGWVDHLFHKIWPPSAINYSFWPQNPPSYRLQKFYFIFFFSAFWSSRLHDHLVIFQFELFLFFIINRYVEFIDEEYFTSNRTTSN